MKDEKKMVEVEAARRSLLKKIGVSGGALSVASALPDAWVKPVLNTAVLPVHAEMSVTTTPAGPTTTADPNAPALVSVSAFDGTPDPGPVEHTDTDPNNPVFDSMMGPEFTSFEANTVNAPEGTEVTLDITLTDGEVGHPSTYMDTATTTANVATFGDTGLTTELTNINATSMGGSPTTGTATFTLGSSMLSIDFDWTPAV